MNKWEYALIIFGVVFIAVFLVDYIIVRKKQKRLTRKKSSDVMEISYLIAKFNLDKNKLKVKKMILVISLLNAFIIAFTSSLILSLNWFILIRMLLGFVLILALIYAVYELYGRYLVKKGYGKDGK